MLLINLDHKSTVPLYKQLFDKIKSLIDGGVMKPGDKMPSSRMLAEQLGINRTTVYRAYEELWSRGYLGSSPGSYTRVRKPGGVVSLHPADGVPSLNWEQLMVSEAMLLKPPVPRSVSRTKAKSRIDFTPLSPDPLTLPVDEFRKCINRVLLKEGKLLLQYGDPMGYAGLRQYIAERSQKHAMLATSEQVLLTNGIQEGLDLLLRLFVKPGSTIVTESPTYSSALSLFRFHGATVKGIPMKEDGMDLKALEHFLQTTKPVFIYTIPNFHNPSGISTSQEHREKLLHLCEQFMVPLAEDGFEEEMKYFGKAVLPVKSMDSNNVVIYLGTFSKVLFPGLRVGWITADERCIQKLCALKQIKDISGPMVLHAALFDFCRSSLFESHLKRFHSLYRKRMIAALKAVRDFIPKNGILCTRPAGGYTFWVEISNGNVTEEWLIHQLEWLGVSVSPGHLFFPEKTSRACFRISIAHLDENKITEGIKIIGEVLNSIL